MIRIKLEKCEFPFRKLLNDPRLTLIIKHYRLFLTMIIGFTSTLGFTIGFAIGQLCHNYYYLLYIYTMMYHLLCTYKSKYQFHKFPYQFPYQFHKFLQLSHGPRKKTTVLRSPVTRVTRVTRVTFPTKSIKIVTPRLTASAFAKGNRKIG